VWQFFQDPKNSLFKKMAVFDEAKSPPKMIRCTVQFVHETFPNSKSQVEALHDLTEWSDKEADFFGGDKGEKIDCYFFVYIFWSQFATIWGELLQNFGLGVIAVLFVSFFFIPNILGMVICTILILMIVPTF